MYSFSLVWLFGKSMYFLVFERISFMDVLDYYMIMCFFGIDDLSFCVLIMIFVWVLNV